MTSHEAQRGHDPSEGPIEPTAEQRASWEALSRAIAESGWPPAGSAPWQPAPPPLTGPDVRQAVHDALGDVFRETVAPLVALLMDVARPDATHDWRQGRVDGWLEAQPQAEPIAPPAGTWVRGRGTGDAWHLSSGLVERTLGGRVRGHYAVVAACGHRLYADLPGAPSPTWSRRLLTRLGRPTSATCSRCAAKAPAATRKAAA